MVFIVKHVHNNKSSRFVLKSFFFFFTQVTNDWVIIVFLSLTVAPLSPSGPEGRSTVLFYGPSWLSVYTPALVSAVTCLHVVHTVVRSPTSKQLCWSLYVLSCQKLHRTWTRTCFLFTRMNVLTWKLSFSLVKYPHCLSFFLWWWQRQEKIQRGRCDCHCKLERG